MMRIFSKHQRLAAYLLFLLGMLPITASAQPYTTSGYRSLINTEIPEPIAASAQLYTISADGGEVADEQQTELFTGLIWRRCAEGMTYSDGTCTGAASKFTFDEAMQYAKSEFVRTGIAWRVPTKDELASILNKKLRPAIDPSAFPATPSDAFWSSSLTGYDAVTAWNVNFYYGSVGAEGRYGRSYVRLVRAGQLSNMGILKFHEEFKNLKSSREFVNFINTIITYRNNDLDNLIPQAEAKRQAAIKRETAEEKANKLQIYRDAFENAYSSSDLDNFISTYRTNDPDKLIPKAEAKKRSALAQERKEAERQRRADAYRREHACDDLYVGKVFSAKGGFFGITQEYEVVGFSARSSMATIKSSNGYRQEVSCSSIP